MSQKAYSRQQAAREYGVGVDVISAAIHSGELQAKRSGKNADGDPVGKYLISAEALDAWFKNLVDA